MGKLTVRMGYSVRCTLAIFTKINKLSLEGFSQSFQLNGIFSALSKSFEKVKTFSVPLCFSATLHPSGKWLVTGGDDFKLYKFDYKEEKEVGEHSKLSVFSSKLAQ